MNKRDNSLDFFRGLAAISVILIHTCFWSGTSYVPIKFQSLSLLIDVPLFVFISGMSFNFSKSLFKTIKGFCKLWYKYIIFILLYYLLIFIFDRNNFSLYHIFTALFFKFSSNDIFKVVPGSFWFLFMFFTVSILSNIVICTYNKYFKTIDNFKYIILIVFIFYGISYFRPNFTFIPPIIFMYSLLYLSGYYLYNYKIKNIYNYIIMFGGLTILYLIFNRYLDLELNEMQTYKANIDYRYLLFSSFSILTVFYLKDRIKIKYNNIIAYIGRNALTFYFTQGISSSILYFILPIITVNTWYIKLILLFIINLLMTFILSFIVKIIYENITKIKFKISLCEKKL